MFFTFLDKLGSFFDRRFILAYWLPSFVFGALLTALWAILHGLTSSLKWWNTLSAAESLAYSAGLLFLITILSLLLQPFTVPLTQLYVGYWPRWMRYFREWGEHRERANWWIAEVSSKRLLPTRLGNVWAAAYDYPRRVYRIDPAVWLPRLTPLLPEAFRAQMDGALIPVFCLLNLSSFLIIFAFVGGALAAILDQRWWFFLVIWSASLVLSWICYVASISQAKDYGMYIRVAFDLYRHELIKQLRIPLPDMPEKEFILWGKLGRWLYYKRHFPRLPWKEIHSPPGEPLYFDNHKKSAVAAPDSTLNVTVSPIEVKLN